jgi:hypothetical protein
MSLFLSVVAGSISRKLGHRRQIFEDWFIDDPDGKPIEEFSSGARRDQTARPGIAGISKDADETVSIHLITIVSVLDCFWPPNCASA